MFNTLDHNNNQQVSRNELWKAFDWFDINTDGVIKVPEMFSASVDSFTSFCSLSQGVSEVTFQDIATYYW
jgi:Ca2+-binding EF-hand superfamily protein